MFDKLLAFEVDIIPRHLTIITNRSNKVSFTYPLLRDKEVVIAKAGKQNFDKNANNIIHIPIGSAYIDSVAQGTMKYTIIDGFAFNYQSIKTGTWKVMLI